MDIVVCIKQVPGTTRVEIDETTGVLRRDRAEAKLNPYDLYALETALRLRERYGGVVKVITMGPPNAVDIIKEAYATGADEGYILTDAAFAGSDTLATSYALSQGIRRSGGYDLIVCGRQTTDGDTAQAGPETAEFLSIPHVSNVTEVVSIDARRVTLIAETEETRYTLEAPLPCLITVDKGSVMPRLPSYKKMVASADKSITRYGLDDLYDTDPANYGLRGSPTNVINIFPPERSAGLVKLTGDGRAVAEQLFTLLTKLKHI